MKLAKALYTVEENCEKQRKLKNQSLTRMVNCTQTLLLTQSVWHKI